MICDPFSPYKAPFTRHTPGDLLPGAGSALLETQRAWAPAVDVQRRQPLACHGAVSRKTARDQALRDLDDTGIVHLVRLRGTSMESVSQFDTRARRWIDPRDDRAEQSTNGSNSVALGVWLVFDGPTRIAFRDAGGVEREPRARGAAWMGAGVRILLAVLARVDGAYGSGVVVVWIVSVVYLACRSQQRTRPRKTLGVISRKGAKTTQGDVLNGDRVAAMRFDQ